VNTWDALVWAGSLLAAASTAHTAVNLRRLRHLEAAPPPTTERVSVLLPVRDEAGQVGPCLAALRAQLGARDLEILVLDDGSTDDTVAEALAAAEGDPRIRLLTGAPLPAGWLGKPHACHQLAAAATGSVLVLLDADVRLAPSAVAAGVDHLRQHALDLLSAWPRQLAVSPIERLVQPLQQWSWATALPLGVADALQRPSMTAANGQFLVVDAGAYRRCGGHGAVRAKVLDDIALARTVRQAGGRVGLADASALAECRMYQDWPSLREGYTKSLWSAFGSRAGAAGVLGWMSLAYLVPAVATLRGSAVGLAGYGAAVVGRYLVARRTGGRTLPDVLSHPLSVGVFVYLTTLSWRRHRRGDLSWKGRPVVPARPAGHDG
jgi:hypothetical protein